MTKPPENTYRRYRGVCICGIATNDYRNPEITMTVLIEKCQKADPSGVNPHDPSLVPTTYSFMDY